MSENLLRRTAEYAISYLAGLDERPVGKPVDVESMRRALGGDLPEDGQPADQVLANLVEDGDPGIVATSGPRYFGFVIGGTLPVALAADWMTSTWDQNAGLYVISPANSVAEETAGTWLAELFGLPVGVSVGFVTGCQAANFSGLAAARHFLLDRAGWDVERKGLYGAPEIQMVLGDEAHVTIHTGLQMLGLGGERVHRVPVDGQGRMLVAELKKVLANLAGKPILICAQAGNVNTGAFDPIDEIADLAEEFDAWLHIDGAFGLWANASPDLQHLVSGIGRADSWATDGHKWLNVPYDSGLVFCKHPQAHRSALTAQASYLQQTEGKERDPFEWTPEFSRRARGFAVWAALKYLGRSGVRDLIERTCAHARRFADLLGEAPGVEILNEVVLNQALVRFSPSPDAEDADKDEFTRVVIRRVQEDGTCWLSGTAWQGKAAMRISVCNWSTMQEDVDKSAEAILRAVNFG
ncbi:MAG TPA: aminotransferase class V-fold PLP-dependent enzyme [Fimbriimonadaceae bacterium]|nr:aminotransferase class V-fold PLP-dependent enzyme [Fimbriimonadaceae bacterium]